jgi:hypothetical protein
VFVWAAVLRPRRAIKSLMTYWQLCGPGFGQEFLHVEWDGFYRSEADELYHAVWDTIEGSTVLGCPVAGHLALMCSVTRQLDEASVVAHVYCTNESLQQAIPLWMDAPTYLNYTLEFEERGKFAESHQ